MDYLTSFFCYRAMTTERTNIRPAIKKNPAYAPLGHLQGKTLYLLIAVTYINFINRIPGFVGEMVLLGFEF